ncbi:MAG: Ig-like domain-containing protein [Armatimonadetes bacterium]|nr:Ig-like domain-containing protein [Armatimonadota bacterium]
MIWRGKLLEVGVVVAVIMLLGSIPGWAALPVKDGDPNTIGECLTKPDGSTVTLTGEQVIWRGRSGKSFAIKEWFEKYSRQPRLLVVSTKPLPVEEYWSVDLTGTLHSVSTKAGTQRVILVSPENVRVRCDLRGRPILIMPMKEIDAPWLTSRSIVEIAGVSTAAITTMDGGLPPLPDDPQSNPAPDTRSGLKFLPDGAHVHVRDRVASFLASDYFCLEEPDRSSAIRVDAPYAYVMPGDLVEISGSVWTVGGEKRLVADVLPDWTNDVTVLDSGYPVPRPIGMPCKAVGGGACGIFAPAVGSAVGTNNTGMLVRIWGKVTEGSTSYNGGYGYYLDDGSNVVADGGRHGIRVYEGVWRNTGDFVSGVTGAIGCEIPDGATASIPTLYATTYYPPASGAGAGTVSGTVTADANASGKTVRIYGTGGSATTTLNSNGVGTYTLSAPTGDHTFAAELAGYSRDTAKVTVTANQTTTCNFTLASIGKSVSMFANPTRIAPDGSSTSIVTAIVADEEGRRLANQPVSWSLDLGSLTDAMTTTDGNGVATAIVHSTTNHETATVWAQSGSAIGGYWVEYAAPGDPSILPVSPAYGETLSGGRYLEYWINDPDGTADSFQGVEIYVDGQVICSTTWEEPWTYWDTFTVSNGSHSVKAKVTDAMGNIMFSPLTWVTTDNLVSALASSSVEVIPGSGTTTISASLSQTSDWDLTIKDSSGQNVVYSASGSGDNVSYTWDGDTPLDDDLFQYTVTATSNGKTESRVGWLSRPTVPDSQVQVLCAAGSRLSDWSERILPLYKYAKIRGFKAKRLPPQLATYERIGSILANGVCRMLQIYAHCGIGTYGSLQFGTKYKTNFELANMAIVSNSYDLPASNWRTVEGWGLRSTDQMAFVFQDGCESAKYGAFSGENNDLAVAYGFYNNQNLQDNDRAYCGWRVYTWGDDLYANWIRDWFESWHYAGRTLDRAIWLTWYNHYGYDEPYDNLRMLGGAWDSPLVFFEAGY